MTGSGENAYSQDKVRPEAVAGQFYPSSPEELNSELKTFFSVCSKTVPDASVRAVIVPHAGYVFSGRVAAAAYSHISPTASYKHIFILGPSHRAYIQGASVDTCFAYAKTPLGKIPIDQDLCLKLVREAGDVFSCVPEAHIGEHCLEVQLPFLQYRLKTVPSIVPIVIGTQKFSTLKKIAAALKPYWTPDNLFVISSDFSHYPGYDAACKADRHTAEAIATGDVYKFIESLSDNESAGYKGLETSACGQCAIATLLMLMEGDLCRVEHISYENSGDSPYGEKDRVVGYNSFVVTGGKNHADFILSDDERAALLKIARKSIQSAFDGGGLDSAWSSIDLTDNLKTRSGAFVTLNENGRLRGCIGQFGSSSELYLLVAEMARAAAFEDPRFQSLSASELPHVNIEISVLTPLRHIDSAEDFHYGKEGIYMSLNGRSGTFLPQVAGEVRWTKEEFLGHCAQDKAGIGWDGWKKADLYTYKAIVFGE